ncbi:MAG: hypothetical protein ACK44Q_00680, partial [Pirellulaceae bacterium]
MAPGHLLRTVRIRFLIDRFRLHVGSCCPAEEANEPNFSPGRQAKWLRQPAFGTLNYLFRCGKSFR